MSLPVALMGVLAAILIVIHVAAPRTRRLAVSAASFFRDIPRAEDRVPRWRLANPISLPLIVRLLVLALLIASLLNWLFATLEQTPKLTIGLWVFLDTSGSMLVQSNGGIRLDTAKDEARRVANAAYRATEEDLFCVKLTTFDAATTNMGISENLNSFDDVLDLVEARPLPTDLSLISSAVKQQETSQTTCPITHIVVVTDQARIGGIKAPEGSEIIWRTVGVPVENAGILQIKAVRDPITGDTMSINVDLVLYGDMNRKTQLQIVHANGRIIMNEDVRWIGAPPERRSRVKIDIVESGRYMLRLSPIDAYRYDDEVEIEVAKTDELLVDWRLPQDELFLALGWNHDPTNALIRVQSVDEFTAQDEIPTLLIGRGVVESAELSPIGFFDESSAILDRLNLDVMELIQPSSISLPPGFRNVLMSQRNEIWVSERNDPLGAYIPGLPLLSEGDVDQEILNASLVMFFNAFRWLVNVDDPPPLYSLTNPNIPVPEGTHIALHPNEGNTFAVVRTPGEIPEFAASDTVDPENIVWQMFLAAMLAVLTLERIVTAMRGESWR